MENRASEFRRGENKVLFWSLSFAAALHVALFLFWPTMTAEPFPEAKAGAGLNPVPVYVDVQFGPPDILEEDGSISKEPPDRVLRADRILNLHTECPALAKAGRSPVNGSVRIRVGASGDAAAQGVYQSTGDPCTDRVIATVAGALKYHWLPSGRFPAPVDLIQPVSLHETQALSVRLPTRRRVDHQG